MWNWIKENSDWLCSVTFGRFPPVVRFFLGVFYELFDYALRVIALLIPGSGLALNGPYLFVAVLLAGSEGIKWGLGDALIGFIPFGDWFPGLSVACFRVWRGYAPDPGQILQRKERGEQRMGCLSYTFRVFLTVLFTAASLYFGGQWAWSNFYDYRDLAWEKVKGSPAGLLAIGQDKAAEKFEGAAEIVKPWLEKGKQEAGKKIDELSRTLGIGRRSSGETKKESEARKRMAEGKEEEEEISPPAEETEERGEEKTDEDKEKAKLLERAKELELGPRASELYAGETTTKKAEGLREQDLAYYGKWFLRVGIANLVLFLSLFFLPREIGTSHRLDDYISMDDDEL